MIKLIILDVDGTLTKGDIIIGSNGEEFKQFNVKDGYMIVNSQKKCNKIFSIITGRKSNIMEIRAKELGIEHLYQGIQDKVEVYEKLKLELNVSDDETAYMGDDLNDLAVLQVVGLAAAPANAVVEVKERVQYICHHAGGQGAVRELLEYILKEQGLWKKIIKEYLQQGQGDVQ